MKRRKRSLDRAKDYRQVGVRAKTVNETDRSIEALISTETPVDEMDWERYEIVPRVLLATGAQIPKSGQVPLLDSHNRYSVEHQLGSIRNLTKEEGAVSGRLTFSETATHAWTKVREGHVTDVSVGFRIMEETYIPEGQTKRIKGRDFTGPMNVATKWRLDEGSITPIGADEAAKMRGLDLNNLPKKNPMPPAEGSSTNEEFRMNAELRKLCVERGMDEKLSDADAQAWLVANADKVFAKPETRVAAPLPATDTKPALSADEIAAAVNRAIELREQAQRDQRAAFERDCNATLELMFGSADEVPAATRDKALACRTMEDARKVMQAEKKAFDAQPIGRHFQVGAGESQLDKHRALLQTAFAVRSLDLRGHGVADKLLPQDQRAKGWEVFKNIRLLDFARECLMADGYRYEELRGLSGEQIAKAAMGWPERLGLRHPADMIGHRGYAYHTTGSLAYVTLDAMNKNVSNGYSEAPSTWRGPMRQAASVPDFKNKHVIKFSASGNLPIWQDNMKPVEGAHSNEKETYAVEARALTESFSWQLWVNDDQDTLSRIPSLLGAAAARTVNVVAWSQITSNPVLSDGQALFLATPAGNRKRSNLTTGAGAPSVLTLQTLTNKMMQMRGLNTPEGNESADILNIQPVYIVGPTALRTTILQLVRSSADPAASGNSGVYNPAQGLTPVFEPLLDAATNGTTAWYLFASPSQVDTAELSFLQGQESPVVESYVDEATWCRKMTVVQSFAAKAIDHRGMQKHDGA